MDLLEKETCSQSDDTRLIPLTQGQFAQISTEDFERVSQFKWYAKWNTCTRSFYAVRTEWLEETGWTRNRHVSMARFILGLKQGDKLFADHANHDTLNNTRVNLRICTRTQQMQNQYGRRAGKSKYKGVYWKRNRQTEKGRWIASIQVGKIRMRLGGFSTEEAAGQCYIAAAKEMHGEFACLERTCPPKP